MGIMETMFGVFPPHKLFELDYHLNLFTFIKDEQVSTAYCNYFLL